MSLEKHGFEYPEQRYGNCKFTRRTRFGIGVVALVGTGLIRAAIEDDPKHPKRVITIRGTGYLFARRTVEEGMG